MGIAFQFSHRGYFAEVARVRVTGGTKIRLEKCGPWETSVDHVINPSTAINQVQGGVIEGMSHVMSTEITFERGRTMQSNFHDYDSSGIPKRRRKSRSISSKSDNAPTGIGEPALPPAVPAISNALFAATGKRYRSLPLARHGFSWA